MLNQLLSAPEAEVNPLRANRVWYVRWGSPVVGYAWIGTKEQLNKVKAALEREGVSPIVIETHVIPRDKSALLSWLRASKIEPQYPVRREVTE